MPVNDDNPKGPETVTAITTLDAERDDLLAALATARSALTNTVRGLGERPTASALCLGGLIKHVASIEEGWLRADILREMRDGQKST
ncbi:hypothetical protein Aple_020080 [Acrocarpospora pleiomorpha]|uniref:Uncharacterized protein n=1 Tax=Acrocarpospora pleiomorpha TaxID=90975 RepID=A0A5M3XEC7_9ACTN|nr:DUF664 domain-containing protein [Acrocarpospora pleiomorpha]GES19112.1 hypothetical protein Aple_020080 [Acrocarpospora pleiomorpha]